MAKTKNFRGETRWLTLSMPATLLDGLDAEVERCRTDAPHQAISRSALVRHFLSHGLQLAAEQRRAEKAMIP